MSRKVKLTKSTQNRYYNVSMMMIKMIQGQLTFIKSNIIYVTHNSYLVFHLPWAYNMENMA